MVSCDISDCKNEATIKCQECDMEVCNDHARGEKCWYCGDWTPQERWNAIMNLSRMNLNYAQARHSVILQQDEYKKKHGCPIDKDCFSCENWLGGTDKKELCGKSEEKI